MPISSGSGEFGLGVGFGEASLESDEEKQGNNLDIVDLKDKDIEGSWVMRL